jgi:hypothetical protein
LHVSASYKDLFTYVIGDIGDLTKLTSRVS